MAVTWGLQNKMVQTSFKAYFSFLASPEVDGLTGQVDDCSTNLQALSSSQLYVLLSLGGWLTATPSMLTRR